MLGPNYYTNSQISQLLPVVIKTGIQADAVKIMFFPSSCFCHQIIILQTQP